MLVDLHTNLERSSPEEILRESRKAMSPLFLSKHRPAKLRFESLAGTGRTATAPDEVLIAAAGGRIESLLVSRDAECWGSWDPAGQKAAAGGSRKAGDEELLNAALVHTLRHRGDAFVVPSDEMPTNAVGQFAAAVLRL